eukprot:jgi/Phyca11/122244/e_gw1.47.176.1
MASSQDEVQIRRLHVSTYLPQLAVTAAKGSRSATRTLQPNERLVVKAKLEAIPPVQPPPEEIESFWGTFSWADNPWIPDGNAPRLTRVKYNRIQETTISRLEIYSSGRSTYTVTVPGVNTDTTGHTVAKLERWTIVILLCLPRLNIGETLGTPPPLRLRRPPRLKESYMWTVVGPGRISGADPEGGALIVLHQLGNGLSGLRPAACGDRGLSRPDMRPLEDGEEGSDDRGERLSI